MTAERQLEYAEALAAYKAAKERLIEVKRHYDPKSSPEAKAKAAEYRARRRAEWNSPEFKAARELEFQEHDERNRKWIEEYERRWRAQHD